VIQSLQDARPARSRDHVIGGGAYEHREHVGTVNRTGTPSLLVKGQSSLWSPVVANQASRATH
jgi:hypothetical protein